MPYDNQSAARMADEQAAELARLREENERLRSLIFDLRMHLRVRSSNPLWRRIADALKPKD